MLDQFRNNEEIQTFISKVENSKEEVVATVKHHLIGSTVDENSFVQALEFFVWGEPREKLVLQCDNVSDFPYIRRCLGVLLGPPSKQVELFQYYGKTAILLTTVLMGDVDGIRKEDIFYVGSLDVGALFKQTDEWGTKYEK